MELLWLGVDSCSLVAAMECALGLRGSTSHAVCRYVAKLVRPCCALGCTSLLVASSNIFHQSRQLMYLHSKAVSC